MLAFIKAVRKKLTQKSEHTCTVHAYTNSELTVPAQPTNIQVSKLIQAPDFLYKTKNGHLPVQSIDSVFDEY